jgi:uncharacterized protein YcfJ
MRFRVVTLALALLGSGFAQGQSRYADENVTYGYAQVLRATPVYEMVRVRVPEQRCEGNSSRDDGTGGTVAGALVGGALGNQVGKGDGRKASTIAGAVIGGVIGRRIDRNNSVAGTGRCRMVEVERDERRITSYDVEYQYKGEKYMSRLDADPGIRLRIRIAVSPDDPSLRSR